MRVNCACGQKMYQYEIMQLQGDASLKKCQDYSTIKDKESSIMFS